MAYKWEDDCQKTVALAQKIFDEAMWTYNAYQENNQEKN